MKRIIIYTCVLFTIFTGLVGCYKDIVVPELGSGPDDLPPQQVSFQTELAPLLNTSCAVAGCHVSGAYIPYLTPALSYSQITNGGFLNLANPKESKLYKMITGEMAQYMPAPAKANTQKIYDWIRNGAPNN